MLSTRLLHSIENHADELAGQITRRLREEPNLMAYHGLADSDLYDRNWDVRRHLRECLAEKPEDKIPIRYEEMGRQRRQEGIPLHEVVLALLVTKDQILRFARSEGLSETMIDLYGKEELEFQISRFFDHSVYYVVRGYEEELRLELRGRGPMRSRPMYQVARF